MLKLVITNGWSDLNAGDSAIIMSLIRRFQIEYGNNINVTILSELHYKNKFYDDSIDKIKEVFPEISISLISSPFFKVYDNNKFNKIREISSFTNQMLKVLFIGKKYNRNNQYINAIREADVITSKGGHFIHDRKGINSIIHLLKCLYPIIIAEKLSKDYFFIAQSFGPFYNDSLLSKVNTSIVKYYLNRAKGISVREEISYEAMKKIDVNENIMNKTSDYAFLINDIKHDSNLENIIKEKYMAITLRQHVYANDNGEFEYLNNIRKLCNYVYDKYKIKSLIVPHVKGPNDFEDDVIITKQFEKMLKNEERENYIFNYTYLHAKELVKLYSNAEILIGTRFHSVIFALVQDIPALAISYSGYKANIMKQFGMDDFMINIEEINNKNFERLVRLTDKLINNNHYYRKKINEESKTVLLSIMNDNTFKLIKKSISSTECKEF